jgi:hypothetical protein
MTMTWEAFRLTSKSPGEVLLILGPHGVDDLVRKAMDATWREYPEDRRTFDAVKKRIQEVFQRNMRHWSSIKKPTPASFFENLLPYTADGYVRQAMVLTWMMMPRAGGRDFKDTRKIIARVFERNLAAWDEDNRVFSGPPAKSTKKSQTSSSKLQTRKKTSKKKSSSKTAKKPKPSKRKV